VDWIDPTKGRGKEGALLKAVINLGFYKLRGISRLDEELSLTKWTLCSMEVDRRALVQAWLQRCCSLSRVALVDVPQRGANDVAV
jgi:hypothetical protein